MKAVNKGKAVKDALRHWCRYQPRTHQDVRNKLYNDCNLHKSAVESLLADMIEEGLVSEGTFANAFAHDRFKLNGWGAKKIEHKLRQRQISDYCVHAALGRIDTAEYKALLQKAAEKKWAGMDGKGINFSVRQH